jgi:hypothetical protein
MSFCGSGRAVLFDSSVRSCSGESGAVVAAPAVVGIAGVNAKLPPTKKSEPARYANQKCLKANTAIFHIHVPLSPVLYDLAERRSRIFENALRSILRGMESICERNGIPAAPVAGIESIDLSPSPVD